MGFLPKVVCDVKKVEIARGVRLCKSSIEPFFIRVPRNKVCVCVRVHAYDWI